MTDSDDNWPGYLSMLIYGIQFSQDPISQADRIVQTVVVGPGESANIFLDAIKMGLASKEKLAELIPQNHSEDTIRDFLIEVARKLEKITKNP